MGEAELGRWWLLGVAVVCWVVWCCGVASPPSSSPPWKGGEIEFWEAELGGGGGCWGVVVVCSVVLVVVALRRPPS